MNTATLTAPVAPEAGRKVFTKIRSFSIENFKGIKNLTAELDGKSCLFYSKQDGGKTCASQHAIATLLQNFPGSKLRKGEAEGRLVYDLADTSYGDSVVQITFDNKGKETVEVWLNGNEKPEKGKTAIDFLKSLRSPAHDLDINELLKLTGQKRAEAIIKALGIDITDEKEAYSEAFEERKNEHRDLKSQESRIEIVTPEVKALAAKEIVSTSDLAKKLKEAADWNNAIDTAKANLESYQQRMTELKAEEEDLLRKLEANREAQTKGQQMITEKETFLANKAKVSTRALEEQLQNAEANNKQIEAARNTVARIEKERAVLLQVQERYDAANKEVILKRQAMFDKVNFYPHGIEGLKITLAVKYNASGEESNQTEASVRYHGMDFSDTEIAEGKIWAMSLKLKAALLGDGQLGFFRMQANLLDNTTILQLAEEAEKMGISIGYELNTQGHDSVQVTTDISELIANRL